MSSAGGEREGGERERDVPAADDVASDPGPGGAELPQPPEDPTGAPEPSGAPVSLTKRLREPRTIISIVLPLILIVLFVRLVAQIDVGELVDSILAADPWLLLAAFLVYYLGFPLRGFRWVLLLRGTGFRLSIRDSTEIIFLSWLVNCLVPAKLGDVYRAYLLKLNSPVSLSRTFGTVFIERVLDLFAIAILGLLAGFWSFRLGLPPAIQVVVVLAVVVIVGLAIGLFSLRNFGRRILNRLPVPARFLDFYDRFEEGVFNAVERRYIPLLGITTVAIWMTEALRLWLVVEALGFPDVSLGLSGATFVALIGSLLTAVPLSPAGLGIVELGVVGVLVAAYGIPIEEATTIALVDRAISVFSIIVFGSIAYALSPLRRGAGLRKPLPQPAEPGG